MRTTSLKFGGMNGIRNGRLRATDIRPGTLSTTSDSYSCCDTPESAVSCGLDELKKAKRLEVLREAGIITQNEAEKSDDDHEDFDGAPKNEIKFWTAKSTSRCYSRLTRLSTVTAGTTTRFV